MKTVKKFLAYLHSDRKDAVALRMTCGAVLMSGAVLAFNSVEAYAQTGGISGWAANWKTQGGGVMSIIGTVMQAIGAMFFGVGVTGMKAAGDEGGRTGWKSPLVSMGAGSAALVVPELMNVGASSLFSTGIAGTEKFTIK